MTLKIAFLKTPLHAIARTVDWGRLAVVAVALIGSWMAMQLGNAADPILDETVARV